MNRLLLLVATVILALGSPSTLLQATDYFVVDADGPSGGDGSVGNPFGTITEALANAPLVAGDTIQVAAGTYLSADEDFPLVVPDGISIIGADKTTTILDAVADNTVAFAFSGGTAPTLVSGFSIEAGSAGGGFAVTTVVADLTIRCNVVDGGVIGVSAVLSGTSPLGLKISSNSFFADKGVRFGWDNGSALADIAIVGNCMTGSGATGVEANFGAVSSTTLNADLLVASNKISGYFVGIYLLGSASGTGAVIDIACTIESNSISSCSSIGIVGAMVAIADGEVNCDAEILDNCIFGGSSGLVFRVIAITATATAVGQMNGNSVQSADIGIFDGVSVFSGEVDDQLDVRFNCASLNFSNGVYFSQFASAGTATRRGEVYGNVVMNNGLNGVLISSAASGTGVVDNTLSFGTLANAGRNVFRSNNTALSGDAFNFHCNGTEAANFKAVFNGWDNFSSALIEGEVDHEVDDPSLPLVEFEPHLRSVLGFAAPGSGDPAQLIQAVAGERHWFVQRAGKKEILVTVNGVPAKQVRVQPGGKSVDFAMPWLPGDVYELTITNPGGQSGTVLIAVVDSSGGCFVATAAHGDEDAPEVQVLRDWRDQHLATNAIGRWLVSTYYDASPALAEAIADRPWARSVSRATLAPVVGAARLWMEAPWALGGIAIGAAWMLLRRKRG